MIEKPQLFLDKREFSFIALLLLIIISIRLYILYSDYKIFISKPFYFTYADIIKQYKKDKYTTLRVYSSSLDLEFFTNIYKRKRDNFPNKRVYIKLFPSDSKITFSDYLTIFYIKSKIIDIRQLSNNTKDIILDKIAIQHTEELIREFYQAIFLANPISKELREKITKLGVNHLIALSGFHLTILWGILFFILNIIYKPIQQIYFPYRFNLIDVGFIVLVILAIFVYFVNSPASLIRSYTMILFGWLLLILGVELISFEFLAMVILVTIAIFPKMVLSLAFWLSIAGVFYIFLLLKNFKIKNRVAISIIISFGIFILMLPVTHLFFTTVTINQLYSPILSLIFTIFYPLSIFLHLINLGNIFDTTLLALFELKSSIWDLKIPISYGVFYIILSIGAIYVKRLFYLLLFISSVFAIYIYVFINFIN